jgi:hypothetical protein
MVRAFRHARAPYFSRNTLHYGPDTYVELHRVADPVL